MIDFDPFLIKRSKKFIKRSEKLIKEQKKSQSIEKSIKFDHFWLNSTILNWFWPFSIKFNIFWSKWNVSIKFRQLLIDFVARQLIEIPRSWIEISIEIPRSWIEISIQIQFDYKNFWLKSSRRLHRLSLLQWVSKICLD